MKITSDYKAKHSLPIDGLLFTSSVAPSPETPNLALLDPEVRLSQTIQALKKWNAIARNYSLRRYLVDNSNQGPIIRNALEKHSLRDDIVFIEAPPPTPQIITRGKGAAEAYAIHFFLENSREMSSMRLAKVNGRYFVQNFLLLASELPGDYELVAWVNREMSAFDSRCFFFRSEYLRENISRIIASQDDRKGQFLEHALFNIAMSTGAKVYRLDFAPVIDGVSGTWDRKSVTRDRNWLLSKLAWWMKLISKKFIKIRKIWG